MTVALVLVVSLQVVLAISVLRMFTRSRHGQVIPACDEASGLTVSIIIPVLNEEARIATCLDSVLAEARATPEIVEILVVDGGSADRTVDIVQRFGIRDDRIKLVDASPIPATAAGKAWGLHVGLARASGAWVLTIDADCTVESGLTRSLASFAEKTDVVALSVATRQSAPGLLYAMLHPSLLTTLVYRFGPPGYKTTNPKDVLANGQCFFASKDALQASGALRSSLQSLCEDITIARTLASTGHRVGFFEAERSVRVEMYSSAAEAWKNWPRSLVMRDQYFDHSAVLQLARVCLVQAAPLPLAVLAAFSGFPAWFLLAQAVLLALRIGVLVGTRKAYTPRAGSFWLSPLLDLPVALRLIQVTFQRRFVWRGRAYVREDNGSVVAVDDQVTS